MRMGLVAAAIAPLTLIAIPAQAQDSAVASAQIFSGAYDKAEQKLLAELRIHPNRPELLLNLAAVYVQTGRDAEARALYTRVLAQDDVLMDLRAERTVGSHAVAQNGLKRIETVQFSAR
ncbi:tetratricopeptide repeat protein [Sphingomonas sp. JC676]|uniref:tetratricopeptide repeat protein n=1 Tax=Sphingomonas sp. JC676 TaxID=2768065 RepID=UPI0016577494|nr:tetratricopeptide repeat protein [Sphingomonas sp. JC676]MBC9031264.1 tetratricopeptide repeat protein [Sphingomonas sp. JC676]